MGVQQSPGDISLTASSMLSGGQLDPDLKSRLEMSPPGSDGAAPVRQSFAGRPTSTSRRRAAAGVSREETEPGGVVRPDVPPRDRATGRFTTAKDPVSGMWRLTPSSRA